MNATYAKRLAGFTLLDAMIAVVVLTTGILALTLLQVMMMRSAAESRERSVAMNLAQNIIEQQKADGNQALTGYQALDNVGTFLSNGKCDYANAGTPAAPGAGGLLTDFRYCLQVKRFRASGNTFAEVASSGGTAPAYGGFVSEFKQLIVNIGWRKADGTWGDLRLGDALSGIPLINSNDLQNRPIGGTANQPPAQVSYDLSGLTQNTNFIPIAVGDGSGSNVAATNPTPKVIGGGVAETSFQVFTYSANGSLANVQKEVDTKVVGCKCSSISAPSLLPTDQSTSAEGFLTRAVRPTYWDGNRYTEPKIASYQTSDLIGQQNSTAVGQQSPYCDICCRDHHDPSSLNYSGTSSDESDDLQRFDPYRTDHTHYTDTSSPDAASKHVTTAGQNYAEVCRVIRVNGIYRVSQDPLLDHFAYIPTDNTAISYQTTSAADGYKNFVQAYMHDRLLPIVGYTWSNNRVAVASLEDSNGLNSQAGSAIDVSSGDRRYLQNRALLLDKLSYEAKTAIQNCIDLTGTGAPSDTACVLGHASFSSINLTELTKWFVTRAAGVPTDPIVVSPKNFSVTTPTGAPVAGQVTDVSGAIPNSVANALASINRSISTLADRDPVFFQASTDTFWPAADSQSFRYVGGARPSLKITVTIGGLSYFDSRSGDSVAPYVGWSNPTAGTQGDCPRKAGTTQFICDLYSSANAADVHIRMFNYYQQLTAQNNAAICGSGNSAKKADLPRCNLFRPSTVTGSITFVTPAWRTQSTTGKPMDDEATVTLGTVVDGGSYTATFEESPTNPLKASFTCDGTTGQPVLSFNDNECRR